MLPRTEQVPAWRRLASQMVHFFALLLWVAAALAVLGGMPALAVAIVAVVLVNGVFAFVQGLHAPGLRRGLLSPGMARCDARDLVWRWRT